jgi:hypothetical protein
MAYRYRDTVYRIAVMQSSAAGMKSKLELDSVEQIDGMLRLVDDKQEHEVKLWVSASRAVSV